MTSTETYREDLIENGDPHIWEQLYGSVAEWMEVSMQWSEYEDPLTEEQLETLRAEFARLAEQFAKDPMQYPYSATVRLLCITKFAQQEGYALEVSY